MANYLCRPLTEVPDYLVVNIKVPAATTLHAGEVVDLTGIDSGISGNYSVFSVSAPATATLGHQMAIVINGGFEQLPDGRRPEGQPDYTKYEFAAGDVVTAIILTPALRFEISVDALTGGSTAVVGNVAYPVDGAYALTVGASVAAGTYSSVTVQAKKYFRVGGQFGAQFVNTLVVAANIAH